MSDKEILINVLRIAGIILFLKIFDNVTSFITVNIIASATPSIEGDIFAEFNIFYYGSIAFMLLQLVLSFVFFLKPEIIVNALLKEEKTLNINITPFHLLKVLLLTLGVYWFAISIISVPEQLSHIYNTFLTESEGAKNLRRENPITYFFRLLISIILLYFADRISSNFYEKK